MAKPTDPNDPMYRQLIVKKGSHGPFDDTAYLAQQLKTVLRFSGGRGNINTVQCEALDMMCTKIARIIMGDPDLAEHWNDIAGYATLVAYRCDK